MAYKLVWKESTGCSVIKRQNEIAVVLKRCIFNQMLEKLKRV